MATAVAPQERVTADPYAELAEFFDRFASEESSWKRRNGTYHRLIEQITRFHVPPGLRVLEIGSGKGRMLDLLRREGHDAEGVEITDVAPPTTGIQFRAPWGGHGTGFYINDPALLLAITGPKIAQYNTQGPAAEKASERLGSIERGAQVTAEHMTIFPNCSFLPGLNTVRA